MSDLYKCIILRVSPALFKEHKQAKDARDLEWNDYFEVEKVRKQ